MQCGQCICNFRKYVNYKFIFHFNPLPNHSLLLSVLLAHHLVLYAAVERHIGHNPVLHHKAVHCQQGPVTWPTLALLSICYWWRVGERLPRLWQQRHCFHFYCVLWFVCDTRLVINLLTIPFLKLCLSSRPFLLQILPDNIHILSPVAGSQFLFLICLSFTKMRYCIPTADVYEWRSKYPHLYLQLVLSNVMYV